MPGYRWRDESQVDRSSFPTIGNGGVSSVMLDVNDYDFHLLESFVSRVVMW